ncbi:TPA: shikimate kinase, partial [Streptococcus agalactiae]|nr:shikimate kinase [Streptococcus agalactiae]MCK6331570.1 shikimate kinase [Streptococcus agalactiae]
DEKNRRPLFLNHSKEEFYDIYQKRMLLYSGLSDMIIDTDYLTPQKIATVIGESLVNLSN